ncbi:MAG: hypothetical protein JEY97_14515 [Bacteroidales bacterium]|nr:hypothetical protein [Bacteroidales bacterium]
MQETNRLFIDSQTFSELDIFGSHGVGKNLFDMINHCTTNGGEDKLKRLFKRPKNNIREIEAIQETVKYFTENLKNWNLPVSKEQMNAVEVYFFSKPDPLSSDNIFLKFLEGAWLKFSHKSYNEVFRKGTKNAIKTLICLKDFIEIKNSDDLPIYLKEIFNSISEFLSNDKINKLIKDQEYVSLGFLKALNIDKIFRDKLKVDFSLFIDLIYELDLLMAMATATKKYKLVFPKFVDRTESYIEINDLYHIFLDKPIKNNILFDEGKNFMFMTGPNMAGKTTLLSSVGLAVFMSHLGLGVPANSMSLSAFNCIFSSMNPSGNISIGYSYFFSEVMRVKNAALTLKKHSKVLMLLDELFKGTNIKDAIDGSLLVIDGLTNWKSSVFILASHLTELENDIRQKSNILFNYFDSDVKEGKPIFNFKLLEGVSHKRLGLLIIKDQKLDLLLDPEK